MTNQGPTIHHFWVLIYIFTQLPKTAVRVLLPSAYLSSSCVWDVQTPNVASGLLIPHWGFCGAREVGEGLRLSVGGREGKWTTRLVVFTSAAVPIHWVASQCHFSPIPSPSTSSFLSLWQWILWPSSSLALLLSSRGDEWAPYNLTQQVSGKMGCRWQEYVLSVTHEVGEVREWERGSEGCGAVVVVASEKRKHPPTHEIYFQVMGEKYKTIFANRSPL